VDLSAVTCTPRESKALTYTWLQHHGFPAVPVVFCSSPEEEAAVALRLGATMALEDDAAAVEACIKAGVHVIIEQRFYNKHLAYYRCQAV